MNRESIIPTITEIMARERIEYDPNSLMITDCKDQDGIDRRWLVCYQGFGIFSIVAKIEEEETGSSDGNTTASLK